MLQPKQITVNCKVGSRAQNLAELTLELQQKGARGGFIELFVKVQWFTQSSTQGKEVIMSLQSIYREMFSQFIHELVEFPEKPEGWLEISDIDQKSFLLFRRIASEPDTIILDGGSREGGIDSRYLVDLADDEVSGNELSQRRYLGHWFIGVAFQGILLTNAETARLAQELQDFLASGD